MKYLLALFVLMVAVACTGTGDAEQTEDVANTAGNAVEGLNLEEIDKELSEIESELNLDEELENLEVSLE